MSTRWVKLGENIFDLIDDHLIKNKSHSVLKTSSRCQVLEMLVVDPLKKPLKKTIQTKI